MHPVEAALLRAVCDDPSDDGPRLALADWWMEHGQELRGEFVRCQLELAKVQPKAISRLFQKEGPNPDPTVMRHAALKRREGELLVAHHPAMLHGTGWEMAMIHGNPATLGAVKGNVAAKFSRGFLSSATCRLQDWYPHGGPQIVAQHPIEDVLLTDREPLESVAGRYDWRLVKNLASYLRSFAMELPGEWMPGVRAAFYPSRAAALVADSWMAVNWARRAAGLKELGENTKEQNDA